MMTPKSRLLGTEECPGEPRARDVQWDRHTVRVTTPVPTDIWTTVASADPSTMPFQTSAWRDCVCSATGWKDASRLYELPGGRQLVLMMARKGSPSRVAVEASWPSGWGCGGVLGPGGVRPKEVALVCADLSSSRALSATVRPGFSAFPAWSDVDLRISSITRSVHVAHFEGSFDGFWARSVSAKTRSNLRAAWRQIERAGIVLTSGNSPELVRALYDTYLRWIDWRARQRKVPASLARWQAQRVEPFPKFATVASTLGADCRIWVAWWEGRPVGATVSLYAGDVAVGWRCFTDRSVPSRFRLSEVLMVESIRHACESGCRYIEMGESCGKDTLASIKARLGGQEHPLAEYCFERLPLSSGRMAYQRFRGLAEGWITGHAR
jgi:hypothetical protein